ncbi:Ribonucleoside-diphosphate reductase [Aphelenchoides bicaudatus]|nr:Ribonucleoside-diphosphate reductase [Aphelenchoides bicaudatus]
MARHIKTPRIVVIKRDGKEQDFVFEKLQKRIKNASINLNHDYIDPVDVAKKVLDSLPESINSKELDRYISTFTTQLVYVHPDFGFLAGRIACSSLHKETESKFSKAIEILYKDGKIDEDVYKLVVNNAELLDDTIDHERDFKFAYFGFKTLEKNYLKSVDGKIVERPQYMYMRVAIGIWLENIEMAIEAYNSMSKHYYIHATPTLFNSGTVRPQLSSCFLMSLTENTPEDIQEAIKGTSKLLESDGGVAINLNCVEKGEEQSKKGLMDVMKRFDSSVVRSKGKRSSAIAAYVEPWHPEIEEFIALRLNTNFKACREMFLALWIPDLFMRRVKNNEMWSLMPPDECPGLADKWGKDFDELYERYESEGHFCKQVKARKLWYTLIQCQCETGLPYMLYKDACNAKSNQKNLGTIKCSNLCTEIIEYSDKDEVAVCNIASIALNQCVDVETKTFKFEMLRKLTKLVAKSLDRTIDKTHYPLEKAKRGNLRHRPVGIGVQGLADAFFLLRYSFTSPEARLLNKQIFETIYFAALEASCDLAEEFGTYESYKGSPISEGILQFDMWDVRPTDLWDWKPLRERIAKHGVRNSLLVAAMPTATTAQILGNNEAFEPCTSNMYTRRVLSGEFQVINAHLVKDLVKAKMWTHHIRDSIIATNGSIQHLDTLPREMLERYRTIWEIRQTDLIAMSADRAPFIDQSQSMSLFVASPTYPKMCTAHFKAWSSGLKTGMYYLRSKPANDPVKFSLLSKMSPNHSLTLLQRSSEQGCSVDGTNNESCTNCSG